MFSHGATLKTRLLIYKCGVVRQSGNKPSRTVRSQSLGSCDLGSYFPCPHVLVAIHTQLAPLFLTQSASHPATGTRARRGQKPATGCGASLPDHGSGLHRIAGNLRIVVLFTTTVLTNFVMIGHRVELSARLHICNKISWFAQQVYSLELPLLNRLWIEHILRNLGLVEASSNVTSSAPPHFKQRLTLVTALWCMNFPGSPYKRLSPLCTHARQKQ